MGGNERPRSGLKLGGFCPLTMFLCEFGTSLRCAKLGTFATFVANVGLLPPLFSPLKCFVYFFCFFSVIKHEAYPNYYVGDDKNAEPNYRADCIVREPAAKKAGEEHNNRCNDEMKGSLCQ